MARSSAESANCRTSGTHRPAIANPTATSSARKPPATIAASRPTVVVGISRSWSSSAERCLVQGKIVPKRRAFARTFGLGSKAACRAAAPRDARGIAQLSGQQDGEIKSAGLDWPDEGEPARAAGPRPESTAGQPKTNLSGHVAWRQNRRPQDGVGGTSRWPSGLGGYKRALGPLAVACSVMRMVAIVFGALPVVCCMASSRSPGDPGHRIDAYGCAQQPTVRWTTSVAAIKIRQSTAIRLTAYPTIVIGDTDSQSPVDLAALSAWTNLPPFSAHCNRYAADRSTSPSLRPAARGFADRETAGRSV